MSTTSPLAGIAVWIEQQLSQAGSPERAAAERRYLKSDLQFFGVALGDIRRVAGSAAGREPLDHDDLVALADALWSRPLFELRMAAVILLEGRAQSLGVPDLDLIEELIRDSKTWALVDVLAADVVGDIRLRHDIEPELDVWAKDADFWIRRSALLAELKSLSAGGPLRPFARRADAMLEEREFFIRKAIGWVLREVSKERPDEVYEWIAPRTHRASGVTIREVVKYLEPQRAAQVMTAYKERRPVT